MSSQGGAIGEKNGVLTSDSYVLRHKLLRLCLRNLTPDSYVFRHKFRILRRNLNERFMTEDGVQRSLKLDSGALA